MLWQSFTELFFFDSIFTLLFISLILLLPLCTTCIYIITHLKTLPYQLFARIFFIRKAPRLFSRLIRISLESRLGLRVLLPFTPPLPTETGTARLLLELLSFISHFTDNLHLANTACLCNLFPASWELEAKPDSGKPCHHSARAFSTF